MQKNKNKKQKTDGSQTDHNNHNPFIEYFTLPIVFVCVFTYTSFLGSSFASLILVYRLVYWKAVGPMVDLRTESLCKESR